MVKHGVSVFGDDPMIKLLFEYGGFGKKTDKIDFKIFLEAFNRFSRHISGHNKSLKNRIGWIWDFFCHVGNPAAKGKKVKFLKKDGLLPILKAIDPDGNHTIDSAQAVIEEMVGPGVKTIDRSSFISYIGECIPDCNEYMELNYDEAYGVEEEDRNKEKSLFDEDTKNNNLANLSSEADSEDD